jgi:VWFA-related protein
LSRRSCLAATLIAALTAGHPALLAQKPSAASDPAGSAPDASARSEPRTVRIDVLATDRRGRSIDTLRASDFSVLDNGVAQKIESVVFTSRAAGGPAAPEQIQSPADEERAAKEPGARVIALYLDEFHVAPGSATERVREAASRFVNEQLRPTDLLAVTKPLDHLAQIRFTRDRDAAQKAIAGFEGRKDDYTPRTDFEEQYLGKSPAAVVAARAQIVMSGLKALIARMGELDGGLAGIVLLTEGFSADVARSRERRLPDLPSMVRAANRFRVALYAFDPGPALVTVGQPADAGPAEADSPNPVVALQALARQTGGDAVLAGGDLVAGLQRVARDLDAYYVVTYQTAGASDGRFHNVQVSASRRDVLLRARSGYWAPLPFELRAARTAAPPILSMRALRRSPLIDSWFGTTVEPDGNRRVIFTWSPVAATSSKPLVRPELVSVTARTTSGKVLFEGDVAAAQSMGVGARRADSAVFQAPTGRLEFDFVIMRGDGSKLDVGAQDLDVPELRSGPPVILAPQLFRAASAREFREISTNANAAPVPGREFRRTDRLLMRVPTYDAAGQEVVVSAKLMNRVGAVLLELSPTPGGIGSSLSTFDLPLARFAPGEYSLEVAAQSESGMSRQLIRLRITG